MRRREPLHSESGVALIAALFAVMILSGLAVLFVATATFETRSTADSRDYEAAIHIAEAAVYDLVPSLNANPDHFLTTWTDDQGATQPHTYPVLRDGTSTTDEVAWVLDHAEAAPSSELVRMGEGEGFAIRPRDSDGPMFVIYAVGWVPSRDAPARRRVLKLQFDSLRYSPDFGLFTGGSLTFGGDAKVTGSFGNVHTNVDASSSGSSFVVEGDFTASGSLTVDCARVTGSCVGGAAYRPPPNIDARDLYDLHEQAAADWYDLCRPPVPGGQATVRKHSSAGPCHGTTVWSGQTPRFHGWRYHDDTWKAGAQIQPGVYYVHRGNAEIGAGPAEAHPITVIAEELVGDGGRDSGHIAVTGAARMTSALSGLTLIADRDITLAGGAQIEGLVAANEQISVSGEVKITGAVIAQDDKNTLGSIIDCGSEVSCPSSVSGDMEIIYDAQLEVPLTGVIRITAWNEL